MTGNNSGPGWFGVILLLITLLTVTSDDPDGVSEAMWESLATMKGAVIAGVAVGLAILAFHLGWRMLKRYAMMPDESPEAHQASHAYEQMLGDYLSSEVHEHDYKPCDDPSCATLTCWCGNTLPRATMPEGWTR